jgi:predicted acylesterase/phospholipase RssA
MIYDVVLEGGGTKSLAFLGAWQEFEARGHTVGRLLGTSAGGIAAAMLACGYTSQEALSVMYDADTQQPTFTRLLAEPSPMLPADLRQGKLRDLLHEFNSPWLPDLVEQQVDTLLFDILLRSPLLAPLLSFLEQGYWYSDQPLLRWFAHVFETGSFRGKRRRFSEMTLEEFYQATEAELSLLVSDVTASHVLILNHRTAPDCPLTRALRMSAGLPLLWADVVWQDAWGTYLGRDITGHQLVEGQLFSPFPIELFFSDLPQVIALVGAKSTAHVLGFIVDETIPVPNAPPLIWDKNWAAIEQLPPAKALAHMVNAVLQTRNKLTIAAVERHIVHLPAKGYRMLEFQLTKDRFNALVQAGRAVTKRYFDQRPAATEQAQREPGVPASPSVIQYVNESAMQQLSSIGVVNHYYQIDTDGGAYVAGNVSTNGGDFIGRNRQRP